jgi:lipoprotein-releasing system permease protein
MLGFRIALRFLRRSWGQSLLIILGIGVGISVQVFVGSLIASLQDSLLDRTVGSSPHVTMEPKEVGGTLTFTQADREDLLTQSGVTAVSAQQTLSVLVTEGDVSVPLVLKGGDLADLDSIYKLEEKTVSGTARLDGDDLLVGTGFAETNGVGVGERLNLVLPGQETRNARVAGIFETGVQAVDEQLGFVGAAFAGDILGRPPDTVSIVEFQLLDPFTSADVAAGWQVQYPDTRVTDWQAQNEELLAGLRSQSASSYMIQVFVVIAVALGIASTLAISAVQKTRQIGILKALGMTDRSTGLVFVAQAAILGIVGTAVGIGIGLGLIAVFDLATAQTESSFPINPEPVFIVVSSVVGVLIALLSASVPYRRTSRLDPIEVIQGG